MTREPYEAPALTEIGTLQELTLTLVKGGTAPDLVNPIITGSQGLLN